MSANKKWKPKLLPYQEKIFQFLEKEHFVCMMGSSYSKTFATKMAIVKHLIETGKIVFPKSGKLVELIEQYKDLIEQHMLQPKQTLATMADQETSLCNPIPVNIAVFDRMIADGYKLNLITGQYEKAPRRTRRSR